MRREVERGPTVLISFMLSIHPSHKPINLWHSLSVLLGLVWSGLVHSNLDYAYLQITEYSTL
jgi:hypothetical protein